MNNESHKRVTNAAFRLIGGGHLREFWDLIAEEASDVDNYSDLEFIDVWYGRDTPHVDEPGGGDDEAHTNGLGFNFSAFNHFIDVRKGPGIYDDFDGYSYRHGSASKREYQNLDQTIKVADSNLFDSEFLVKLAGLFGIDFKVDEGINWWFNDEYVHARSRTEYHGCSPSTENYSSPTFKGKYLTVEEEMRARFPLANNTGTAGMAIPYSVFMPVDNMAKYWYSLHLSSFYPQALGPVLHAIQDACIPHHAAGTNGNWHDHYEKRFAEELENWLNDDQFLGRAENLLNQMMQSKVEQPKSLSKNDWNLVPSVSWDVDMLVTWVALNACKEYEQTYHNFENDWDDINSDSAEKLAVIALAMSGLILKKDITDRGKLMIIRLTGVDIRDLYSPHCSLRVSNEPKRYVEAMLDMVSTSYASNNLHRDPSNFRLVWGLSDAARGVSIESVLYPNRYLTLELDHAFFDPDASKKGHWVKLEPIEKISDTSCATFHLRSGIANRLWFSFESAKYPGQYLFNRDLGLSVEAVAEKEKKNATFLISQPLFPYASKPEIPQRFGKYEPIKQRDPRQPAVHEK